jgi:hypothetical protein
MHEQDFSTPSIAAETQPYPVAEGGLEHWILRKALRIAQAGEGWLRRFLASPEDIDHDE